MPQMATFYLTVSVKVPIPDGILANTSQWSDDFRQFIADAGTQAALVALRSRDDLCCSASLDRSREEEDI